MSFRHGRPIQKLEDRRVFVDRRKKNQGPPGEQVCTCCNFRRSHVSRLSCPQCGNTEFSTYRNERRKKSRRK